MVARSPARPAYLSIDAAADHLGVNPRTIRRRIADGSLPAYRIGPKILRIDPADVDRLGRRIPTAGPGAA